ncbi:MAG TPA: tRNA (N6-threonylcarbamoyladenosine(37)-N6)-methyltransferase TrmO [Vicinamibacterales bacterium]|nr:tRNA (N6-threonylcarbamoyladenosine(37)-N6)-methyltransferase TrmO [Vicinamibacterales bacterium]
MTSVVLQPIGRVDSSLTSVGSAPRQADEGAPAAWLVFDPQMREGLRGLHAGQRVIVITWLDRARRDVLSVHPRGDSSRPMAGVFSTRSPHRPNPLGLHEVEIIAVDGLRVHVRHLEAIDGTPIVDLKPVLTGDTASR